jgi:hypothetical protein
MPLYLSVHQAPGLSEEEIAANAPEVAQQVHAAFRQLYVNTDSGYIVSLYQAEDAKALEAEFERIGFPFDSINEIDYTLNDTELVELVAKAGSDNG